MIKFVTSRELTETYGDYQKNGTTFRPYSHILYLTWDFIGLSDHSTCLVLDVRNDNITPNKENFTTKEVEDHLSMAVLRVVRLFLC